MVRVRNLKTGVEAEWSASTYELNKKGIEQGTISFEVITDSPEVAKTMTIEDFLGQKKSQVVNDVEDKQPEPIIEPEKEFEFKPKRRAKQ